MDIKHSRGFTLVEIAIVLVILGLIIGGVLKGQEMLTNGKLKRIESDSSGVIVAMNSYRDRYLQLPGDDNRADQHFVLYTDGTNDPTAADINGDGDGMVSGTWFGSSNSESANFWKHLRASGLIPGSGDDDTLLTNAFGGNIGLRDGSLLLYGHVIVFGSIEGPIARILDDKLDDGSPSSGRIQSDLTSASMDNYLTSSAGSNYDEELRFFMAFSF